MDFFIKKNATLPVLKMQVVKDGRSDYRNFMDLMEVSSFAFSMINIDFRCMQKWVIYTPLAKLRGVGNLIIEKL